MRLGGVAHAVGIGLLCAAALVWLLVEGVFARRRTGMAADGAGRDDEASSAAAPPDLEPASAAREDLSAGDGAPRDEPALLEIEDSIDLHGFQPRDVVSVVESYLEAAHAKGFREVRLIHGKGQGVQRRAVQSLLARHPLVERFVDAPSSRGGWGATIAWLSAPREPR